MSKFRKLREQSISGSEHEEGSSLLYLLFMVHSHLWVQISFGTVVLTPMKPYNLYQSIPVLLDDLKLSQTESMLGLLFQTYVTVNAQPPRTVRGLFLV